MDKEMYHITFICQSMYKIVMQFLESFNFIHLIQRELISKKWYILKLFQSYKHNVIYKIQYRVECCTTTVIQCCYVNCYISYLKMSFIQICEYFIQYFVCKQKINKISLRFVSIFSVFCLQTKIWIKYSQIGMKLIFK